MNKNKRLLGLLGSGALLLGLMFSSTGIALADGQVAWDGQQGLTDGDLTTEECDTEGTPYIHWVFTDGGGTVTAASLTLGGSGSGTFPMVQSGGGSWSYDSDFFDLATLTASVSYTGTVGQGSNLVVSHGCAGDTEESEAPSEVPSFEASEGAFTEPPSFEASEEAFTEPPSDAFGAKDSSGPADGAWLLVVALGVLLASIVVLTPARAKSRR